MLGTWDTTGIVARDTNKHKYWILKCRECGSKISARGDHIRAGEVISCACQKPNNSRGESVVTNLQRRPNNWLLRGIGAW